MHSNEFWAMIQRVHDRSQGEMDAKCQLLQAELRKLTPADAAAFSDIFDSVNDRAYSWPLWGAAYVINGGCSDDSFSDFRASLISRGRDAFEKALADPDSIADEDLDEESYFYEGFQYAVSEGVESVLGKRPTRNSPHPKEPSGEAWDEDAVGEQFPRLSEKYG
jgi:hypothetical protein